MWMAENRGRYGRTRQRYPDDLTDEECCLVQPMPKARQELGMPQPFGADFPPMDVHPHDAQKAMAGKYVITDDT